MKLPIKFSITCLLFLLPFAKCGKTYYFKEELEMEENEQLASWELEPENESKPFLASDTFEKTKQW